MDDAQIVDLYFARDENAITETKNKYQNMCFLIAHNILYNREDSEECVNDTWLFTWNSIPPKRPSILAPFVSKITRNTAIDRYRKRNAQKRMDSHMENIAGEVEDLGSVIFSEIDVYLRRKEIIEIFNGFLQRLSERDRDIFIRRYWYMDSIKKIADRHRCGENLALEGQYSFNANLKADDAVSKSFVAKFFRNGSSGSQKIDITIGTFKTEDDQIEKKDEYLFSFTATPETLAADTKEVSIKESMQLQNGKTITISKIKYNIFGGTIYGELPDMAENDEFLIRGEDDLGNELVFELNSYRNPDLVFDLTDSGISPNAKPLTLQLYYYADDAGNQFVYQDGDDEFYVEESSSEYGENENPEDRAVPVGDGFMIDLQE